MIGVGAVTFGSLFAYNQVNAASDSNADFKKVREDITALAMMKMQDPSS